MIQESLDQGGDAKHVFSSHMEIMGLSPKPVGKALLHTMSSLRMTKSISTTALRDDFGRNWQ